MPFWAHGFAPPPDTRERFFVAAVPRRAFARAAWNAWNRTPVRRLDFESDCGSSTEPNGSPFAAITGANPAGAVGSGFDSILYFPVIPGGTALQENVDIFFPRRGAQRERSFQFSTRFPFGFAERREMVTAQHDILVYPCLDPQPGFDALLAAVNGELEAQQRGRGNDFYRIRPYEVLESARHVDWKATAHTGDLQVREFAREQDHRIDIYLDLDFNGDSEWLEAAIDCAAFLAFRLSERGARVRMRTQEYDVTSPDEASIYSILRYLALVSPLRGKPPAGPDDPSSFHIVFSADPQRMAALGWVSGEGRGGRLLGLDAFAGAERTQT